MIKKDALLNHGGFVNFPLAWGSDDATILLLSQYGVAFAQDILFSFRQSGVNISSRRNDSLILKNKLSAYLEFFSWLNRFITNFTSVENDEDEFYITYINKNLPSYFRCVTLLVLSASTPKAILCNVRLIKRLKVISVKDYLITLFHSFVKTLRRSLNLNY